jgi:Amt family ammonium transporter
LTGAIIIGPRIGKYTSDGRVNPMPGSNLPLATLGTFLLWFGWFGFNGGSMLSMGSAVDVDAIARIYVNTNIAAAAGVVVALVLTMIRYGKVELTMVLNGALAGLVSITAEPLTPSPAMAAFIGAIGGLIVVITVPLLDKLKIDDVVGAIPVHLFAGIWGTIAVVLTNDSASLSKQLLGIVMIGAFVVITSSVVWYILAFTIGVRANEEDEINGLDISECGLEGYPEFSKG